MKRKGEEERVGRRQEREVLEKREGKGGSTKIRGRGGWR